MEADQLATGVHYLAGRLPQGRIGIGPAAIAQGAAVSPAATPSLTLKQVNAAIAGITGFTGKGSTAARREGLRDLFARCVADEQRFVIRLLAGELRQGALDGVMIEAIAKATGCSSGDVRRAYMLIGDLARVAVIAFAESDVGLNRIRLALGTPVQSMLAQPVDGVESALEVLQRAVLDYKMDGARVQVHKDGSEVAVFSRRLNDVSASVPEVVEIVAALPVSKLVLDGEVIALGEAGRPLPFQTTMRRFGRRKDVSALRETLPLAVRFFDCLHADGEDLMAEPLTMRMTRMDALLAPEQRMPRVITDQTSIAAEFLASALAAGHEGVMAKNPASLYEAGSRGKAWFKVKRTHTLDLVVLAAEWGHGRRRGRLSNLHLGARDPATDQLVMLGKTFKGLTDEMLDWQTKSLLALEVARDSHTVYVEPKLVVEIAFNDVQTSPQYPAGLALRFARVKRYREDKSPDQADTLDTVRQIHALATT